jgi:uncharacterized membrane protein
MWAKIQIAINKLRHKVVNSIAFYPALIGMLFLLVSALSITFEYSDAGAQLKSNFKWLSLKDASTARAIISAIAAGIISITVFSFSMVMIVLNQTASQMSNRILDNLIGSRFQQITLGVYVGTMVFAFFLLSTIRDNDSGLQVPALSTYLLILLTVFDIFLFIYFLHYITQSVKYNVIIRRIFDETLHSMEQSCVLEDESVSGGTFENGQMVVVPQSGLYSGLNKNVLLEICQKNDCRVQVLHTIGTFIMKGLPILQTDKKLPDNIISELGDTVYLLDSDTIGSNYFYGFKQLTEVAVKALSPGINDPGTAIESLRSLFQLLIFRLDHFPETVIRGDGNMERVFMAHLGFDKIFGDTVFPIWDYGKNDRLIQQELHLLLTQLQFIAPKPIISILLNEVKIKIKNNILN